MLFRDAKGRVKSTFAACDTYLAAKADDRDRERAVEFDSERLAIVKDRMGNALLSTIAREVDQRVPGAPQAQWQQRDDQHGRGRAPQGSKGYLGHAADTSMCGVEVRHGRRSDVDLEKVWDIETTTGKGVLYVGTASETSNRRIPLNGAAREAITP